MAATATGFGTSDTTPRSFTFPRSCRTFAIPSAVTSSHHFEKSVSMMMRGADGDAAAALDDADDADDGVDPATAAPDTISTTRRPHTRALVIIPELLHLRGAARATLAGVDGTCITVFRSRLRDDVTDRYVDLAAELHERARGF